MDHIVIFWPNGNESIELHAPIEVVLNRLHQFEREHYGKFDYEVFFIMGKYTIYIHTTNGVLYKEETK